MIALNETWLTESTGHLSIPGYRSIARHDRKLGKKTCGGGVDMYCKNNMHRIALLARSENAERTWSILHTDIGPILIGNWYRPGDETIEFSCLKDELRKYSKHMIGTIILGGISIHHQKWLRHSSGNTQEGEDLME